MRYKTILVTGAAGFIGFHLSKELLKRRFNVVGLDNMNHYYDVSLKQSRLEILMREPNFSFLKIDLEDRVAMEWMFDNHEFDIVINLAAQAGVRYSLKEPHTYVDSNVKGFMNILEGCRYNKIEHLLFASSSSVYGANTKIPFSPKDGIDHPMAIYAATKKANEMMAHSYSSLYGLPCTGIRFFTVYGPYGRPDLSLFLFTKAILENRSVKVFNNGHMVRDFTYIDDIIEGVIRVIDNPPKQSQEADEVREGGTTFTNISNQSIEKLGSNNQYGTTAPYKIYNIGNSSPVQLMDYISAIEQILGKTAKKEFLPMQPGDVPRTEADVSDLVENLGYKPDTPVRAGIEKFIEWYKMYFKIQPKYLK